MSQHTHAAHVSCSPWQQTGSPVGWHTSMFTKPLITMVTTPPPPQPERQSWVRGVRCVSYITPFTSVLTANSLKIMIQKQKIKNVRIKSNVLKIRSQYSDDSNVKFNIFVIRNECFSVFSVLVLPVPGGFPPGYSHVLPQCKDMQGNWWL